MSTDPATIADAVVLAEELEHMPESMHAEWVKDNQRSLISRLRDSERMRKALDRIAGSPSCSHCNYCITRKDVARAALLPEPENANGKS